MVNSYHAHYERTQDEVTACSHDTGRTDALFVNTRTTILAIQQVTAVDGAVITNKAGTTVTLSGAITSAAVTTRVNGAAIGSGAGVTGELWHTATLVTIH